MIGEQLVLGTALYASLKAMASSASVSPVDKVSKPTKLEKLIALRLHATGDDVGASLGNSVEFCVVLVGIAVGPIEGPTELGEDDAT